MSAKYEVLRSANGGCVLCQQSHQELYLVRPARGGQLVALCGDCLLSNLDHYQIDNTRPWHAGVRPTTPS